MTTVLFHHTGIYILFKFELLSQEIGGGGGIKGGPYISEKICPRGTNFVEIFGPGGHFMGGGDGPIFV